MKHHEYQIYYGGFKIRLRKVAYCYDCNTIIDIDKTTKNCAESQETNG